MATAFVGGATGFTGREVVRLLAERGVKVFAHVRPDSPRLDEWRARFSGMGAEADATPWTVEAMTGTFDRLGPAIVFGLLGTTRSRAKAESAAAGREMGYEAVDYALTAILMKASLTLATPPRFVYLSATGTPGGDRPPATAYGLARWKCERELRASGLPYTIARPSFISGPGREDKRPSESLGVSIVNGALGVAGVLGARRLKERYRSTSNTALAVALVRLALDPAAANTVVESEDLR